MTGEAPSAGRRSPPVQTLAPDLAVALAAAAVWSAAITLRFGEVAGRASTLLGSLGCTAVTLGSVAVLRSTPRTSAARLLVRGALLSVGPLAVLGALLDARTHHRPLAGVTFAVAAGVFVLVAVLLAARLRATLAQRLALTILVVVSMVAAASPALSAFRRGTAEARFLVQDLALGGALALVVLCLPAFELSARAARRVVAAWGLAVVTGIVVLSLNMPLRAMLVRQAPMALGPLAGL